MKPYFNMKVLTLCVAMALSAHSALAAPQHRTCTGTEGTQCAYMPTSGGWGHYKDYSKSIVDDIPWQTERLNTDDLKLTVSGHHQNSITNTTGITRSSSTSFQLNGDKPIYINAGDTLKGEFEMLSGSSSTLSLQPEDSVAVYLDNVTGTIQPNVKLTVNKSYAEVNHLDMTQYGEYEANDYKAGSAIEVYGDRGHLTTSADIELNGFNAMGLRTYHNATANMTNHTIQLNGNFTLGFDTRNTGTITTDNVTISGNGSASSAFDGSNLYINNSTANLTGDLSSITVVGSEDDMTGGHTIQNINNSQLTAAAGLVFVGDYDSLTLSNVNHTINLNNSTLTGRSALITTINPERLGLTQFNQIEGNLTINANNSHLSGASILSNQTSHANRNITVNLTNGSTWKIQQNSEIDNLNIMDSTIDLRSPQTGVYNTLTIQGDLTGNGQFEMNSDVAKAQGDQISVNGNVTGSHKLLVHNTLTEPSSNQTLSLVHTAKPEHAQRFTLANPNGVVEVGKYLYTLEQKDGNNWQLVYNTVNPNPSTPSNPSTPNNPSTPSNPIAVNHNFGFTLNSRLAHAQAAALETAELSQSLNNRQTALHHEQRLHGLWIQGEHAKTERDSSTINGGKASGFTDNSNTWQIGYDHVVSNHYVGVLAGTVHHDIEYDTPLYAKNTMKGSTWAVYGGTAWDNGWFADGTLRHTRYKNKGSDIASDSFHINSVNVQVGKNITLNQNWSLVPQAAVTVGHLSGSDLIDSDLLLQTRLGGDIQGHYTLANGSRIQPKVGLYYLGDHHKARVIMPNGEKFDAPTAGHRIAAKAGVNWLFTETNQLSANIQTEHGSRVKRSYVLDIGLTHRW